MALSIPTQTPEEHRPRLSMDTLYPMPTSMLEEPRTELSMGTRIYPILEHEDGSLYTEMSMPEEPSPEELHAHYAEDLIQVLNREAERTHTVIEELQGRLEQTRDMLEEEQYKTRSQEEEIKLLRERLQEAQEAYMEVSRKLIKNLAATVIQVEAEKIAMGAEKHTKIGLKREREEE